MKRLIVALAALSIAHLASAEMLYWMIGDSTNGGSNTIEFNYAVLYATNGGTPTPVGNELYGNENLTLTTTTNPQKTELSGFDYRNSSFYVELFNYDFDLDIETSVGVSERATYDSLVSHGAIIPSGMGIPSTAHVWMPTVNVPEPSSGLLMIVGFSLLALKRRAMTSVAG